jgi:hypothetical protein
VNNLIEHAPQIIAEASKSSLGIFSLLIIALSIITVIFFKQATTIVKVTIFTMLLSGVVAYGVTITRTEHMLRTVSNWDGIWQTETPNNPHLRIQFKQSGTKVTGLYTDVVDGQVIELQIVANANGNVLIGKWMQSTGNVPTEGSIHFVMSNDGRSFAGYYTYESASELWRGERDL